MTDEALVKLLFDLLKHRSSASVPPAMTLSDSLSRLVSRSRGGPISLNRDSTALFATASIEAWQRAVHSLLMSISLSVSSPLWAAIIGYYASHYAFRAAAHILGLFSLHGEKCTIEIDSSSGPYLGAVVKGRQREHDWYRSKVSKSALFGRDPFFLPEPTIGVTDQDQRNRANYGDHLSRFPAFQSINVEEVRERMRWLEQYPAPTAPAISEDRFPDLEAAWILAYQRISRFRKLVDEKVGKNRFWEGHRSPAWARDFTNFDLADTTGMLTAKSSS
jgi:hypothetical protein